MGHRVLLVANRTLGGEELTTAVRERVAAGATELWVLAPAYRPPNQAETGAMAVGSVIRGPERNGAELAEQRLQDALYRFRDLGIPVGGEVSDKDPFAAVSDVLTRSPFDEVVVSTLPTGLSHWLRLDLPNRVHRTFHLPVTTVTAHR